MIRDFFKHNFAKIREINKKYAKPNVEMSKCGEVPLLSSDVPDLACWSVGVQIHYSCCDKVQVMMNTFIAAKPET